MITSEASKQGENVPSAGSFLEILPTETTSPDETKALGEKLAETTQAPAVVALYGDLGTGKTQLVKGFCAALGVDERVVSSPTFTILNEYETDRFPVYHFDAYRIEHPDEFFELGYEEYFYGEGVCLIEWPTRVEALLPDHTLRLRLSHRGDNRRLIELMNG